MLADILWGLARTYPLAVVFLFPTVVMVAGLITLAVLSATLAPDHDNSATLSDD